MDLENLRYNHSSTEIFVFNILFSFQKAAGVPGFNNIQDYYTIQKECLESGKLFEDPEFPPTGKWIRPHEYCKNFGFDSPKFFVDGVSRFDIQQGSVGDCWFVAAIASITSNETVFDRVVCKDNSFDENYAGIFHFRFCIYGKWVDVVIDDRLPLNLFGILNGLKSSVANEFWPALLEKAYAKIRGGYKSLEGGVSSDAFEDFTGSISEFFDLNDPPKNLFQIMEKAVARKSFMACSPKSQPQFKEFVESKGLIQAHAYTVTDAKTVNLSTFNLTVELVRLRNPLGKSEWNGPWSDGSVQLELLNDEQKKELEIKDEKDGEFWMAYVDFIAYFDRLDLCNTHVRSLEEEDRKGYYWKTESHEGAWIKGQTASGCRNNKTFYTNPQFKVELKYTDVTYNNGRCNLLVSLVQKHKRSSESIPNYFSIGFSIYNISGLVLDMQKFNHLYALLQPVATTRPFLNTRGISLRLNLEPGTYVIMPSTFDKDQEAEFLLRISYEKKKDRSKKKLVFYDKEAAGSQIVEKLFRDAAGSNEDIDWKELKTILDASIPEECRIKGSYPDYKNDGFSRDICRSIIAMMDTDCSRKLKFDEFKKFYDAYTKWKDAFQKFNKSVQWKLSSQELIDAFKSLDLNLSAKAINLLFYRYGTPYNTMLFEDFIFCATRVTFMFENFKKKAENDSATFNIDDWITTTIYS